MLGHARIFVLLLFFIVILILIIISLIINRVILWEIRTEITVRAVTGIRMMPASVMIAKDKSGRVLIVGWCGDVHVDDIAEIGKYVV